MKGETKLHGIEEGCAVKSINDQVEILEQRPEDRRHSICNEGDTLISSWWRTRADLGLNLDPSLVVFVIENRRVSPCRLIRQLEASRRVGNGDSANHMAVIITPRLGQGSM